MELAIARFVARELKARNQTITQKDLVNKSMQEYNQSEISVFSTPFAVGFMDFILSIFSQRTTPPPPPPRTYIYETPLSPRARKTVEKLLDKVRANGVYVSQYDIITGRKAPDYSKSPKYPVRPF